MKLPPPEQGLVLRYSYLWRREHRSGAEEGRKDRPCIVMLVEAVDAGLRVTLAPITHSKPTSEDVAIEIPARVLHHLRLDSERQWAILDEVNQFVWPGFDLRSLPWDRSRADYGYVPPRLFDDLRNRMIEAFERRRVKAVDRDRAPPAGRRRR